MIRFIVAFLVLIVPTSLMGATLPLVVKSAIAREDRVGGKIGLLYAINTTGAIVGALIAGFYFIAELGVERSFQIAAATNIAIGVIAVIASYLMPPHRSAGTRHRRTVTQRRARRYRSRTTSRSATWCLWVFFVSGVMSLALEIIWFRMLVIFLRPTAYAFTIMLACVLAGIAIGSAIAAPMLRMRRNWMPVLAVIQALIGFAAVLSFNALTRSQQAIDAATPWFERLGLQHLPGAAGGVEHDRDAAHDHPAGPRVSDRPGAVGGRRSR